MRPTDEKYGEALFAAIVIQPGRTLTGDQIVERCRARIGGYKIPRQMAIVSQLPKSAMGKILKRRDPAHVRQVTRLSPRSAAGRAWDDFGRAAQPFGPLARRKHSEC